jgi:hypothetical protein
MLIHTFEGFIGLLPAYRLFKVYWAFRGLKWTAAGAKLELTCITTFGKPNSPICKQTSHIEDPVDCT